MYRYTHICMYTHMEHVKGPDLQIQSSRISMTKATTGYPRGISASKCRRNQRPGARPMACWNEHLQVKTYVKMGTPWLSLSHYSFQTETIWVFFVYILKFYFGERLWGQLKEESRGRWVVSGLHDVKSIKNQWKKLKRRKSKVENWKYRWCLSSLEITYFSCKVFIVLKSVNL